MKKKLVDRQIKNRYLIYIILCSFFLGSFLGIVVHPVSAISYSYTTGFEGGTVSLQWADSFMITKNMTASPACFYVSSSTPRTGTRGFFIGRLSSSIQPKGYWNMSINMTRNGFITEFDVWLGQTWAGGTGVMTMNILFYNRTLGYSKPSIQINLSDYLYNVDYNNVKTAVGGKMVWGASPTYKHLVMSILANDTIRISYNGSILIDEPRTIMINNSLRNIDRIYFGNSFITAPKGYFFDDVLISYGDFPSYAYGCDVDVSSFDQYGTNKIGCYDTVITPFIEKSFNIPFNGDVKGVDLAVNPAQYLGDPDLNHYFLWVNGESFGAADCFFEDEYGYVLRWNVSKEINDAVIVLEFQHTIKLPDSTSTYWLPGISCTSSIDLDGDGDITYRYHSSPFGVNGIYSGSQRNYDLGAIIYYDSFLFTNTSSPYSDLVTCPKTTYDTFDTIPLFYFISDFTYANSIQLWRNGTQLTSQGFPLTIKTGDFNGESSYTTFHSGKYQFRLVRNSIIRSTFNVTVTNPVDMNFILSVYPNPCEFNTLVSIGYRFYPADGSEGFIGVSEFSDTSNYSSFEPKWSLTANTSGNYTFYPQTNMYVSLWKKSGSSYVLMRIRYLRMLSLFDNTINVGYKSIALSDAVPSVSQRIYGTQVVQGFNTFVRMNNKLLQYVTDTPFYNVYVDVSKGGNYNVELCMETANGSKVLCAVNFSVSSPSVGGAAAETFPPEMKLLFGICCILVAVSCPLMISVKYHVAVPTFVYVVFMAFGIGIGTVLGFLELWLVFLFVVALVAGAVFTIFGHGGQGGGGGDSGTIRKGGILSRRGGKDYAGASRKADYGVSPKGSPGYLKGPGRRGY